MAPSMLGQPSWLSKLQQQPGIQVYCNQPCSVHSIPITLLHPSFGKFINDCESHTPDEEMTAFVLAFASMMCDFHQDELTCTQIFCDLIWQHFWIELGGF